jgi:hypothetical protein
MLHHQETLSTELLNSLKKQEVCVINVQREIHNFVFRLHKVCELQECHMENVLV